MEWTYAEFAGRVAEVAAGLRAAGVRRGDVVGVVLPNSPEYLEVWWAILWLGATFNPVNPVLTAREAAQILADSGATTVGLQRRGRRRPRGAPRRAAALRE